MAELVKVLDQSELEPGQCTIVIANEMEIALFNVNGQIYALENNCPHRGGPLGEGDLDEDIVTCPWHGWQINVRTGEAEYMPDVCAKKYNCKVEDGAIYVEV